MISLSELQVVYGEVRRDVDTVVTGAETALHKLLGVVQHLVLHAKDAYKTEESQLAALRALAEYETAVHGTEKVAALRLPTDLAHIEDVSKRTNRVDGIANLPVSVAGAAALDYDKLAEAMLRAQRNAASPPVSGEVITSTPGEGGGL